MLDGDRGATTARNESLRGVTSTGTTVPVNVTKHW